MGLFGAFRKGGRSARIERLLEEQNSLLREVIEALGRAARTPRTTTHGPTRPRSAQDVFAVSREQRIQTEIAEALKKEAPWRTGPASSPMSPPGGGPSTTPDA